MGRAKLALALHSLVGPRESQALLLPSGRVARCGPGWDGVWGLGTAVPPWVLGSCSPHVCSPKDAGPGPVSPLPLAAWEQMDLQPLALSMGGPGCTLRVAICATATRWRCTPTAEGCRDEGFGDCAVRKGRWEAR